MKKILPYLLITILFAAYIYVWHKDSLTYKFNPILVQDYMRSQDIEDPQGLIQNRIFVSDNAIYQATGYLYATGTDPASLNVHPPLMKYLFGFSEVLTGNPFWVQFVLGLILLWLTYFLGTKLKLGNWGMLGVLGLMADPVFGGMMNEALLDLGQAVFAIGFLIVIFFYPESFILQGILIGLSAASKFWTTTLILVALVFIYNFLVKEGGPLSKRRMIGYAKSFAIAIFVFSLTYIVSFVKTGGAFNIFKYQAMILKLMLTHNSAKYIGGPIILFLTGYFAPWWQSGVARAADWFWFWPVGLLFGVVGAFGEFREKAKSNKLFFFLLPLVYLLLTSTQVPFTRYFILILPFIYLNLVQISLKVIKYLIP